MKQIHQALTLACLVVLAQAAWTADPPKRSPREGYSGDFSLPVVAETYDGFLNDVNGFHVKKEHVFEALEKARGGPVAEGNVGGGTGMIVHGFKGGIGTASRVIPSAEGYTVGVLVNSNHGRRGELTMGGIPVGKLYGESDAAARGAEGSIIIVIATNAPLDARQLKRLAKRAALGLARTGSMARHGSGDFILAFSTGNVIPHYPKERTYPFTAFADTHLNPLFAATVEATQEAILNALTMATTVIGRDGNKAEAINLRRVREILKKFHSP